TAFFACARTFAQRFLAALAIFARPASDSTRFLMLVSSRLVERPKAFPAARTLSNCDCNFLTCFSSLRSSRRIVDKRFIHSSLINLSQGVGDAPDVPGKGID